MTLYGSCWSPGDGIISTAALRLLRRVCGPGAMLRCGPELPDLFKTPDFAQANWEPLDRIYANCAEAGVDVYSNAANIPAHASGGVPLYQTGMGGSSCQILAQWGVPRARWGDVYRLMTEPTGSDDSYRDALAIWIHGAEGLTNTPDKIAWHFVKNYRGEQSRTWAWDVPEAPNGKWHVWGDPRFVEQDKLSAPRPWLTDRTRFLATQIDGNWMNEAARQQMQRWKHLIKYAGFGNEFGGEGYNIDMRFDGANHPDDPTAPDTVKTRLGPALQAYYSGLWDVFDGQLVGFEADGGDILRRAAAECKLPDIVTHHAYGPDGRTTVGALERCRSEIWPQLVASQTFGAEEAIGEVGDDDPMRLLQFIRDVVRERSPKFVLVLKPQYWIDGDLTYVAAPNEPERVSLSKAGEAAHEQFMRQASVRRRAAGR
jgi:hypothetical protein